MLAGRAKLFAVQTSVNVVGASQMLAGGKIVGGASQNVGG